MHDRSWFLVKVNVGDFRHPYKVFLHVILLVFAEEFLQVLAAVHALRDFGSDLTGYEDYFLGVGYTNPETNRPDSTKLSFHALQEICLQYQITPSMIKRFGEEARVIMLESTVQET